MIYTISRHTYRDPHVYTYKHIHVPIILGNGGGGGGGESRIGIVVVRRLLQNERVRHLVHIMSTQRTALTVGKPK